MKTAVDYLKRIRETSREVVFVRANGSRWKGLVSIYPASDFSPRYGEALVTPPPRTP